MSELFYDLDSTGLKLRNFEYIFTRLGLPSVVAEIGCYYGKTTSTIVNRLAPYIPNLQYYAIDPFSASVDVGEDLEEIYQIFIKNLNTFLYKDNIIFLRENSFDALVKLRSNKISPQLIYIDGDHTASPPLAVTAQVVPEPLIWMKSPAFITSTPDHCTVVFPAMGAL